MEVDVTFPVVSEADSVMKVAEWQQTYYASDSGIQSGATTVRDDESGTEYSSSRKYTAGTNNPAAGGGDAAAGRLESSSTSEMPSVLTDVSLLVQLRLSRTFHCSAK